MIDDSPDNKEMEKILEHWVRKGVMKHSGFENGEDMFEITDTGFEFIEEKFREDPTYILLYLQIALNVDGSIGFWKCFNKLAAKFVVGCSKCGTIQDTPLGQYCHECGDDLTKQEITLTTFQKEVLNNMSAKPTVIDSFYKMYDHMKKFGLSEDDIVLLIQKRTNPRVNITDIRATLKAIKAFEKQIEKSLNSD